jgi:large subunit ribosomal protein L18
MHIPNQYVRRAKRVRASLRRGSSRPRLSVFRSDAHIWAQIIDDAKHVTVAAASDVKLKGTKTERAIAVGTAIAKLAIKAGVTSIVFDRGSYRYHGRIKALAEAARTAGLQF